MKNLLTGLFTILLPFLSHGADNISVRTLAGCGLDGYLDGVGEETFFSGPTAITVDPDDFVFVADGGGRLRMISPGAVVTTIKGPGATITDLASDEAGNVLIAQRGVIWKRPRNGSIERFAGSSAQTGSQDGVLWTATFGSVLLIASGPNGSVYVADVGNNKVRKIEGETVSTLAGSGNAAYKDGRGIFTAFELLSGITVNQSGEVFVTESRRRGLRKITPDGVVTTIDKPLAGELAIDSWGTIYAAPFGQGYASAYSADGITVPEQINVAGSIADIAISKSGAVYFTDFTHHLVRVATTREEKPVDPSSIAISIHAGITISGSVGRTYRIERTDGAGGGWASVGTVTLNRSRQLWFDESPTSQKGFYRAVLLP